MDIQDMTTKGTTTMIERYRRIRREIQEEQGEGDEGGFTLIELLIVIVVLGILAAVTVFGLSNVTGQSLTSACRADAKSVAVAQEAYRAQGAAGPTGGYAASTAVLATADASGNRYLRSDPGAATAPNIKRYSISTDAATGKAYVTQTAAGGRAKTDFETDPTICDNIP